MNYDDIFTAYYTLYRAEATVPTSSEDEYKVALPLANEAINRWANYDNTMWKELFTTLQESGDGDLTIDSSTTDYATPDDMRMVGGYVWVKDANGNTVMRYPIVEPQDVQFQTDEANYCYFTGDPNNGFTLHINNIPDSLDGLDIDYIYYKKPTTFTQGSDITEMSQPYFIVHRMLANKFRSSRNPYYTSAKTDAEDVLKTMQLENNSGNWSNPWSVQDKSGSTWGA